MQALSDTSLIHVVQVLSTDRTQTQAKTDEIYRVQGSDLACLVLPYDLHSCAVHGSTTICIMLRCLVAAFVPLHLNLANCHTSSPDMHQTPTNFQASAAVCSALSCLTQQQDRCTVHFPCCCCCIAIKVCQHVTHLMCRFAGHEVYSAHFMPCNLHHGCIACLQALITVKQQQQDERTLHMYALQTAPQGVLHAGRL